jgi:hypothetical protein
MADVAASPKDRPENPINAEEEELGVGAGAARNADDEANDDCDMVKEEFDGEVGEEASGVRESAERNADGLCVCDAVFSFTFLCTSAMTPCCLITISLISLISLSITFTLSSISLFSLWIVSRRKV